MDHVLLLGQHGPSSKFFLLIIHNAVELSVLGCVAGGGFLIEWFLGWRKGAGETTIGVQFLSSEELVESEEEGLCSFGAQVDDGLIFFLDDFEFLAGEV